MDSKEHAARVRAGFRKRIAEGRRAGTPPFGMRVGARGFLVKDRDEQRVLQMVSRLRSSGLSLRAIVSALETSGHTGRTGKPLRLTQVARIVKGLSS